MKKNKLGFKGMGLIASLIFGMLFGAGNLIFPVYLGQLAGNNWLPAAVGFLVTGVLIPLLALIALGVSRSNGLYDFGAPAGKKFAAFFLIVTHLSLGPLFATPRTASTAYQLAFAGVLPAKYQTMGLFLFSAVFFLLVYLFAKNQVQLTRYIGKWLNPLFLLLLAVIFLVALINPMGSLHQNITISYHKAAFANGFLEGYNTMDALAALAFGVTIIKALSFLKVTHPKKIASSLVKTGMLAMGVEAVIYIGLIMLGATSLGQFKIAANGGIALGQIIQYYLGSFGAAFLGIMGTLAVFTTAMGLVTSFAQDMHSIFPKISYNFFLVFTVIASFGTSNLGLTQIIAWATPLLMFLYPLAMALILLSLLVFMFKLDNVVYRPTLFFTSLAAVLDGINAAPAVIRNIFSLALDKYYQYMPFSEVGFGWILPTAIGLVLGLLLHWRKNHNTEKITENDNISEKIAAKDNESL
ncbi:branched-chain amino acid transport system II carrier protein [Liquorilactobacillus capillatus]|uniref:Branched-chain amino acid transport system carrier protein n=1 Tax=Liquorilactobacillus capillatus DSM 19910 TaxID=1423731 RepID=A0A0R1M5Z9_9LACO|nr:branched-chain amino acid transport system II carrier protein [Liquorilactobacillus capillatus]KRL03551.1 branched-chain amino acid transporter [Liquorilactobacillus capillatus DSM 19910]